MVCSRTSPRIRLITLPSSSTTAARARIASVEARRVHLLRSTLIRFDPKQCDSRSAHCQVLNMHASPNFRRSASRLGTAEHSTKHRRTLRFLECVDRGLSMHCGSRPDHSVQGNMPHLQPSVRLALLSPHPNCGVPRRPLAAAGGECLPWRQGQAHRRLPMGAQR